MPFISSLGKFLLNLCRSIFQWIKPAQAYSWKTFILLGFFSGLMALPATGWAQSLIVLGGQILLLIGLHWLGVEKSWIPAPWLTGAVLCIFVFGNSQGFMQEMAIVLWPLVSASIASISGFFDREFNLRRLEIASRQRIVLLFASQALLACWLQFYLLVQHWVETYPSVLTDDFSQSAFAIKLNAQERSFVSPGVELLEALGRELQLDLKDRAWDETQLWFEQRKDSQALQKLAQQKKQDILQPSERPFWDVEGKYHSPAASKKTLTLIATWDGPRSRTQTHRYEKVCTLQPTSPQQESPPKPRVEITCQVANRAN